MPDLDPALYRELVRRALEEDLGAGDITTDAIVPAGLRAHGTLLAKTTCIIAGLEIAGEVFHQIDAGVVITTAKHDGDLCRPGEILAEIDGPAAALLKGERTALNFLQHLSGIATLTRRFVDASGGAIAILDTRKTVPGLRALAKYAVRCGGAANHRTGLFDGVLIKDNHIRIAGGIDQAVARVRATGTTLPIEVEAQSLDEVHQALGAGVDIIMLDNLSDDEMREALLRIRGRTRVEVSGGMTLDRVRALATLGADCVSVGALTHSAPAADISFELDTAAHGSR